MVAVPAPVPATNPVAGPTVATLILLLLHTPLPGGVMVSVTEPLMHRLIVPVIVPGRALTVIGHVTTQPEPKE
jgi:hypothetical protein